MLDFCGRDRRDNSLRFVPERPGVLLHRTVWDARLPAHDMPTIAGLERRDQLVPITMAESGPA